MPTYLCTHQDESEETSLLNLFAVETKPKAQGEEAHILNDKVFYTFNSI